MKHILIIILAIGLAAGAGAQTKVRGGNAPVRTRVIVAAPVVPAWGFGYGFGARFSPFYDPFYSPFHDPYLRHRPVQSRVPAELQLNLDEIENEYNFRLSSTKSDRSITGKERRQKMRELKYEREAALIDARRNYLNRTERNVESK